MTASVEREQAVGHALEVVHLFDVGAARGADALPLVRATRRAAAARLASVSFVALTIGTSTPNASSVRRTASSCRNVTTGLPSAIASIAKTPYQPAFSWSTITSARR